MEDTIEIGPVVVTSANVVATIRIQLYRSPICTPKHHKRVVKGLGLRKVNQIVVRPDTPVFRGMVKMAPHLLKVVE